MIDSKNKVLHNVSVKKNGSFLLAMMVMAASLPIFAGQIPVPLMDHQLMEQDQWQLVSAQLKEGLECRSVLNLSQTNLTALLSGDQEQWDLTPPKDFTVFGLPVESITIYIDKTGEMGASYNSSVVAPKDAVVKAAGLDQRGRRKTQIGNLLLENSVRPSLMDLTCTIPGANG